MREFDYGDANTVEQINATIMRKIKYKALEFYCDRIRFIPRCIKSYKCRRPKKIL